jgi:hypothetical protein
MIGWPGDHPHPKGYKNFPALKVMSLWDALTTAHTEDSHVTPLVVQDPDTGAVWSNAPRLMQESLPKLDADGFLIAYYALLFDVDDPACHGGCNQPASDEDWRLGLLARINALPEYLQRGLGYYFTKKGARLVWVLDPPVIGPRAFRGLHHVVGQELARHGIAVDELKDWARCYRLPNVIRDGVRQQHGADLSGLGPLTWHPTPAAAYADPNGRIELGVAPGPFVMPQVTPRAPRPGVAPVPPSSPYKGLDVARVRFVLPERILEGRPSRNKTLYRYGASLRAKNVEDEQIVQALRAASAERCVPPLEEGELYTVIRSVLALPKGSTLAQQRPVPLAPAPVVRAACVPSTMPTRPNACVPSTMPTRPNACVPAAVPPVKTPAPRS